MTYQPEYTSDELDKARELAEYLRTCPEVVLRIEASAAYSLAGALQLAARHPQMAPGGYFENIGELIHGLVDQLAEALGGPVAETIEAGWDPANDR